MAAQDPAPDDDDDDLQEPALHFRRTPVPRTDLVFNSAFVEQLDWRLNFLLSAIQPARVIKYGHEVAEEWPMGHTPPEYVEKRAAELKEFLAFFDADSPPSSSDDDGDGKPQDKTTRPVPTKGPAAPKEPPRHTRLPTPSSSVSTVDNSHPCLEHAVLEKLSPEDEMPAAVPSEGDERRSRTRGGKKRRRNADTDAEVRAPATGVAQEEDGPNSYCSTKQRALRRSKRLRRSDPITEENG